MKELKTQDSISARTLFTVGRGQQYFREARKRLSHKLKRRMLQVHGGVFPCNLWRKRIGVSDTEACALCGQRDTYSHRVCVCKQMHDAVTVAHDHAWQQLHEKLVGHLDPDTQHWYDSVLSTIPLRNLTRSLGSAGRFKPDTLIEDPANTKIFLL